MTELEYFTVPDADPNPPPKTPMELAVTEVRNGATIGSVAKKYKIPRSTLSDKVRGVSAINATMGPSSVLSCEEEKLIVEWIKMCGRSGFSVTKFQILVSVGRLVVELKRINPFRNGIPGKKWFAAFLRRNPEISQRTPQNLTISRAKLTEEILRTWFVDVIKYLVGKGLMIVLKDPSRLFNADEAAFFLNPKGERVLYEKGAKNVYGVINADEKECNTVLVTVSAAGDIPPPMVIFKYERIPKELAESVPRDWGIGRSESGWMTGPTFYEYITNIFNPWLDQNNIERQVILFVDGHSSHTTLHLSKFCEQHSIILVALPPNATHILQPLDVGVFRTLKLNWVRTLNDFRITSQQPIVKRKDFCPLLKNAISSCVTKSVVTNSFRKCGIFPWNPDAVDYSKIRSVSVSPAAPPEVDSAQISQVRQVTSETVENEHLSNSQRLLAKLNSYLGPDKVEFFSSVATASDWPDIVDAEDHNLFTIWRQMYVEAHSAQSVDVSRAERILPQEISSMVTVQLTEDDSPSDKAESTPELDDLIDFQGIIPPSPSKTETLSTASEDVSSSISILTPVSEQNQPSIQNISSVPSISSSRVVSLISPFPLQHFLSHYSATSTPKPSPAMSSVIRSVVEKSAAENLSTHKITSAAKQNLTAPLESSSCGATETSLSKQISILTPESSSCKVSPIVRPPSTGDSHPYHEISTPKPSILTPQQLQTMPQIQNPRRPLAELSNNTVVIPVRTNTTPVSSRVKKSKIPSPFKRAFLYPEPIEVDASKKRKKEVYPSVVTSELWQNYHEKKIQDKENLEIEKQARKVQREENRKKRLETQALKLKRATKKKKIIKTPECSDTEAEDDPPSFNEEDYVIVEYEEEFFPGQILKMEKDKAFVKTMKMAGIEVWKWPVKDDRCYYDFCDIKCLIQPPTAPSKRGHYKIPEMKKFR